VSTRVLKVLLLTVCSVPLTWATTAFSFTGEGSAINNGTGYSLGFQFTVTSPVLVDALGWWDAAAPDDLTDSHQVGIFDTSGDLLTSTTVLTTDPITDGFAYDSITPYLLSAGTYVISGVTGTNDEYASGVTGFTTAPWFTYGNNLYIVSSTLQFPTTNSTSDGVGFFGPNFDATPTPEPATFGLIGVGLLAGAVVFRKRQAS